MKMTSSVKDRACDLAIHLPKKSNLSANEGEYRRIALEHEIVDGNRRTAGK